MYPHLTQQNPTITNKPSAYDSAKRHPAFGPSQPMAPSPSQYNQRHYVQSQPNTVIPPFDPSTSSPIFYGYVPVHSLPPMGPKL